MIVNRRGERFVNEALTYNDLTKVLLHLDPNRYEHPNLPAWMILDQGYLSKYTLHTYFPGMPLPDWLIQADSLTELAAKLGIDPERLAATVERFNGFAESGVDLDFGRGQSAHDRDYGDATQQPNPSLGTIAQPPFCALPIQVGTLGTKGGVRVDENSQARHVNGSVIPGLYAAGNVMASAMGGWLPWRRRRWWRRHDLWLHRRSTRHGYSCCVNTYPCSSGTPKLRCPAGTNRMSSHIYSRVLLEKPRTMVK